MASAVVADHLLLTAAGLWPRSKLLGPTGLAFPIGGDSWRCRHHDRRRPRSNYHSARLALLAEHSAKATFFCIGERVEQYAQLAREIVSRGHAIENHSQRHLNRFSVMGPRGMRNEIERAQDTIGAVTVNAHDSFVHPPAFAACFSSPCWRGSACAWQVGRGEASTR